SEFAPAGRGHEYDLDGARRPRRVWQGFAREKPYRPPDGLLDMSSLKKFKPRYWRSLAELENTPAFREYVENEFAAPLEEAPPNSPERRRFLELMGASFAMAGVTGCFPEDKLVPLSRRPEGLIPGVPRKFASAIDIAGNAAALYVTSYDGRPIKV